MYLLLGGNQIVFNIPIANPATKMIHYAPCNPHWRGNTGAFSHWYQASGPSQPHQHSSKCYSHGGIHGYGNTCVSGGTAWVDKSILKGTLVGVTDRSYIRELFPNLCSAAFILECSKGQGRVVGSFSETLIVANTYRGELLGLMAIHLILLSVNKIHPTLVGSVEIVSDCLGALKRVTYLPPYQILL
jgi:hypothetical protein